MRVSAAAQLHSARFLCAIGALVLLAMSGPWTPALAQRGRGAPARERAVPFRIGETLTYDVSWSSLLVAGTAVATVAEKKPSFGSTAYYIVAEGRPLPLLSRLYALYYKMDTLIDSATTLSQRGSLYSEEGARHRLAVTRFDRKARTAFFEIQPESTGGTQFIMPVGTQDGLAALYALRAQPPSGGERVTIPVADGGALYTLTIEAGGVEPVRAAGATLNARKLQVGIADARGEAVWKNVAVWLSEDGRRLPVKMQADLPVGAFVLALREAR